MEKPGYYSVIPSHVRYDEDLKPMEIIMYGELTALANFYGYSYATNSYFAKLYNVHKNTVSLWINKLKEKGYIRVEIIRNENNEIEQRKIYINTPYQQRNLEGYQQKDLEGYQQKDLDPINKNLKGNSTSINITSMNSVGEKQQVNNSKPKGKKINDKDPVTKSLSLIQEKYFSQISPIKLESLTPEIEKLGDNAFEIISVAVDYTTSNNKNPNYLTKVINNWADDNVTTVEQAQEKVNGKPKRANNDWIESALKELGNNE